MSFGSRSLPKPTKPQIKRWEEARFLGCIFQHLEGCHGVLDIHHIKSGNLRMGHWWTVCLCRNHHNNIAALTKKYGVEVLMYLQDNMLGYITPRDRERVRNSRCTAAENQVKRNPSRLA